MKDLNAILGKDAHWQVNKKIARYFKCNNTAILLSDLVSKENYFREKKELVEGEWFYNTGANIEEDTNITPHQQRKIIKNLVKAGFIETTLKGLPAKLHFKISHNKLLTFLTTSDLNSLQQDVDFFNTNNNKVNKNKDNKGSSNLSRLDGRKPLSQTAVEKKAPPSSAPAPPSKTEKKDTARQRIIEVYFDWFKMRNDGIPPNFDGIEGKAANYITTYLEKVAIHKAAPNEIEPEELKDQVENMMKYILGKWETLEPFLQRQTKLSQINSNITNIINFLKNGSKTQPNRGRQNREQIASEGLGILREHFRNKESD